MKGRLSRTQRRIHYTVIYANTVINVCRTAFFNIHGIKEKRVRSVLSKTNSTGIVEPDLYSIELISSEMFYYEKIVCKVSLR